MARLEQDRTEGSRRPGAKAPLTDHPAFAVLVALWFATLLGIGSLILPVALIEKVVVASGLPSVLAAAAPPLGFTARAGIALLAAFAGAALGFVIARQVARKNRVAAGGRSVNPAELVRRPPVSAHAELGSEGFDGNGTARSRELLQTKPERPAAPASFDAPLPEMLVPAAAEEPTPEPVDLPETLEPEAPVVAHEPLPESRATSKAPLAFSPPSRHAEAPAAAASGDLAELGLVQLVHRLEATIEKHRAWVADNAARAVVAAPVAEPVIESAPAAFDPPFGPVASDEAEQARQAYFEAPVAESTPFADLASEHDEDDDTAEAMALLASLAVPSARPAADEPEPRQVFQPVAAPVALTPVSETPLALAANDRDGGDEPRAAQEPLQAARPRFDREDAGRALREALCNLQRMGKAS